MAVPVPTKKKEGIATTGANEDVSTRRARARRAKEKNIEKHWICASLGCLSAERAGEEGGSGPAGTTAGKRRKKKGKVKKKKFWVPRTREEKGLMDGQRAKRARLLWKQRAAGNRHREVPKRTRESADAKPARRKRPQAEKAEGKVSRGGFSWERDRAEKGERQKTEVIDAPT